MNKSIMGNALVVLLALTFGARSNRANAQPVIKVRFNTAQSCWNYYGKSFSFKAQFTAGQKLVIIAAGESDLGDGHQNWSTVDVRQVDLQTPDGIKDIEVDGDKVFKIPKSSPYDISIWPHAIQGLPGMIIICKR